MQALRSVVRPSLRAIAAPSRQQGVAVRALSVSAALRSGHSEPIITGQGAKPGTVPTDEEQATGLERFELSYKLRGEEAFSLEPLEATRVGTVSDPVKVFSLDATRIIGCTGVPADSHDTYLFTINKDKPVRCPECGSAYQVDFHGEEHGHDHH